MTGDRELELLMARADLLLTDTQHPLDPKQSAEVTLMLIQQIVNLTLAIQREIADLKADLSDRQAKLDERIDGIEESVETIQNTMRDYPSLTWLLRYRFSSTSKTIFAILIICWIVVRYYPALAAWFGLPALP